VVATNCKPIDPVSRLCVHVVLRISTSISLFFNASNRWVATNGTNSTASASPTTAAARARQ